MDILDVLEVMCLAGFENEFSIVGGDGKKIPEIVAEDAFETDPIEIGVGLLASRLSVR